MKIKSISRRGAKTQRGSKANPTQGFSWRHCVLAGDENILAILHTASTSLGHKTSPRGNVIHLTITDTSRVD